MFRGGRLRGQQAAVHCRRMTDDLQRQRKRKSNPSGKADDKTIAMNMTVSEMPIIKI